MVNKFLLVDTDILIDVGRGIQIAIERLEFERQKYIIAISSITQMELLVGCRNKNELKILDKFLQEFEIITLDYEITQKAVEMLKEYRLSHGLLIADSLIAATSLIHKFPLLTKNRKHFNFIRGIKLLKYP